MKEFIKLHYFDIAVFIFYIMLVYIGIETFVICCKNKMIIDYIFDWWDRRKKK